VNTTPPNVNAGANAVLNCANNFTSTLNGSSSTPDAQFAWSGPGVASNPNMASITVNAQGTYTLVVTDPANGCTASAQASVSVDNTTPQVSAGPNKVINCYTGPTVTLTATSNIGGSSFSWSGAGIVGNANQATITVNAAGTYTVTVTSPGNGCTAT